MKIKLLNDGGYNGMEDIEFPIVVNAIKNKKYNNLYGVYGSDLMSIGAKEFCSEGSECFDKNYLYHFELGVECEVIE